jgi:hypothetical protein
MNLSVLKYYAKNYFTFGVLTRIPLVIKSHSLYTYVDKSKHGNCVLSTIGKVFDSSAVDKVFFPHRISFIKSGMSLIWIQFFSTPLYTPDNSQHSPWGGGIGRAGVGGVYC